MSAQFPNVPDMPGVPVVARADALLQSIRTNTASAVNGAQTALAAAQNSDISAATGALTGVNTTAGTALAQANTIFSADSGVVGSLSGTVANASSAVTALGSGDINGAVVSIEQTIDAADRAFNAISGIVNPTAELPLVGSAAAVNAETTVQWGLFTQDGDLAAQADNIVGFESSLEARISDYPVAPNDASNPKETLGFSSYNKVIMPYDIRLIMSRGGSVEDRQDFLKAIQDAWQSVDLFNVVTPECVYLDVNVVHVRRMAAADRGMGLMTLEIALRKVRQTATLSFTHTKDPSGAAQVKDGSVQGVQTAAAQQYAGVGR